MVLWYSKICCSGQFFLTKLMGPILFTPLGGASNKQLTPLRTVGDTCPLSAITLHYSWLLSLSSLVVDSISCLWYNSLSYLVAQPPSIICDWVHSQKPKDLGGVWLSWNGKKRERSKSLDLSFLVSYRLK